MVIPSQGSFQASAEFLLGVKDPLISPAYLHFNTVSAFASAGCFYGAEGPAACLDYRDASHWLRTSSSPARVQGEEILSVEIPFKLRLNSWVPGFGTSKHVSRWDQFKEKHQ